MGVEHMIGSILPDLGWTCDSCGHHNDDIYNDECESCGADRSEDAEE